jgi:hypothetical protein
LLLEEDGERTPLHVQIFSPVKTKGQQDYFCIVRAPSLLGQDKRIFGIDPDQASSLFVDLIKSLLQNKESFDCNGMALKL